MIEIKISENGEGKAVIQTEGYLIMYLHEGKVQSIGKMEMSAIAPLLGKMLLEKMSL